MKTFRVFCVSMIAAVVWGAVADARAADRVQTVVHRAVITSGPATTNASKTFRLAGTAIDSGGKPVAGAVVECYQQNPRPVRSGPVDMEVTERMTTGDNGGFEFKISAAPTILVGRKPGLAAAWAQYWNVAKDLTEEQLCFTPPAAIRGVVVDEAGKPVTDAEVWLWYACAVRELEEGRQSYAYLHGKPAKDCFSTRTGADGRFTLKDFPTNSAADFAVKKEGKVVQELPREHISPETMRFQPGQREVTLVLEPGGSIEGKVVIQETKEPLAGVRLSLRNLRPGPFSDSAKEPPTSAADGTFRLADLAAGDYEIYAVFGTNELQDWVAETASATVESGQTTRDVQVLAIRGGILEVTAVQKGGRTPLAGVGINAFKDRYNRGAVTESNGVAFLRLPPGEYKLSGYLEGSHSEQIDAAAEAGKTNRLTIELSPPPKIAGTIRDPSGSPVAGARVSVIPNWGNQGGDVTTDSKGHYELSWDPQRFGGSDRSFALLACDTNRVLAAAKDIEPGTSTLDLQLEPGLVIVGRVEDVNGKPLSKASVNVYVWSGNSGHQFDGKPFRTDGQGRFEITGLPRGRKCSLDAKAKGYGSANRTIQEDTETNRVEVETCVLKTASYKLAGEVVGADDQPAVRAHVYIYGEGQPNSSTTTDEKGRFKYDGVCEGTISVSASLQIAYGNARVQAGDTNVVIRLGVSRSYSSSSAPKRSSLRGKALPDLASVELGSEAVSAGKPLLLCLFDIEQRPSRRFVKELAAQIDALQQKGVTVVGLQAAVTTADSFKEWKSANPLAFPVGRVGERSDKTKWACDVEKLPWLILTDGERRVTAEGFGIEELDAKLKSVSKP